MYCDHRGTYNQSGQKVYQCEMNIPVQFPAPVRAEEITNPVERESLICGTNDIV